jgi:glyoxylase-like metal-dependent hydrolase (beta-lactamase superfamily II)
MVNLGVTGPAGQTVLIDSGNDESAGRRLNRFLNESDRKLAMIVNTHSNADHVGGNAYLQKKWHCRIAVPAKEAAIVDDPDLEPLFLWGARAFPEVENKFLRAQPSKVTDPFPCPGPVPGTDLEAVALPGHFIDMAGLRTPEGIFFIADSLFSEEILAKYRLVVALDVDAWLKTLEFLEKTEATLFVPAHAAPTEDISHLVAANRAGLLEVRDKVSALCTEPRSREDVLAALCIEYGMVLNPTQILLYSVTVGAHLSSLARGGEIAPLVEQGRLLWKRT